MTVSGVRDRLLFLFSSPYLSPPMSQSISQSVQQSIVSISLQIGTKMVFGWLLPTGSWLLAPLHGKAKPMGTNAHHITNRSTASSYWSTLIREAMYYIQRRGWKLSGRGTMSVRTCKASGWHAPSKALDVHVIGVVRYLPSGQAFS